ncbi:glycoside hydrolase family 78 protein [Yinghuangia sp. ASG 101]|uniref:family 78 glycoside hydrolase catalytic domain n=1 Tax=Yinghuangia sp. ASG 101 TaxID=2896848 RepID=UPI001E2EAD0B|nr:family 78 glycoside hydrolase catalytic domain [Yinghuangia sp. ASG 101]UGQ11553.1 glycoside hydrolase family 78 protein [Yinghuangia sp. ASG 101]
MPSRPSVARRIAAVSAATAVVVAFGLLTPANGAAPSVPSAGFEVTAASDTDWTAKWIGRDTPEVWPEAGQQNPAPLLRREFRLDKRIANARLSIVGLGYYEAWIDGRRVGDQVLDPPPSAYDRTAYSRTFDVTTMLRKGDNAIGVTLGRGNFAAPGMSPDLFGQSTAPWRAEPRLLAQLDVTFTDGTTRRVVSDGSWRIADGPTRDALYLGEHYDARQAKPGWTDVSYDDAAWEFAREQPSPTRKVVPAAMPPVKVTDTLDPVKVTTSAAGTKVYDFGRVTAGWARITVNAAPGTKVTLTYGEQLEDDGTVYQPGLLSPAALTHVDSYTLDGGKSQTWEPGFTRHGFRYIEVSSTAPLTSFRIQGRVAHTALASTGRFTSANPLLNTIHANQRASLQDNMWGLPTDTPWRDRQGWTADAYLYLDSAALNFDVESFYGQWLRTWRESQTPDGSLPVIAPDPGGLPLYNDPSWGGTLIPTAWTVYRHYGNPDVLRDNYDAMARWMNLMRTSIAGTGGLYRGFSFGDWASPGSEADNSVNLAPPEGSALTANADLYHEARVLARIADELGRTDDAAGFDAMADNLAPAFNAAFLDAAHNVYRTEVEAGYRQTSNVVALAYGLVPADRTDAVFANLVKDIVDRGTHLDTGAIGTKLLLPVLTEHGRGDLAYELATQTDYPSWGHWVRSGATTSWETWSNAGLDQSLNHAFLGTVDDWFHQYLAGIRPAAPGYREVLVAPVVPKDLRFASASVKTPRGTVSSSWRHQNGKLTLTVRVPDGTPTEIRVPLPNASDTVTADRGATPVRYEDGCAVYRVTSGTHRFRVS